MAFRTAFTIDDRDYQGRSGRAWWEPDLASVFDGLSGVKLEASLGMVARIAQVVESDGLWNGGPEARNAYRTARYWITSGRWDLVLVVLNAEGRTKLWPSLSKRWGGEPFNDLGFPKTGLISILSLRQAALYRTDGGPDRWIPFPMQEAFLRASNWRNATSPSQNLNRQARLRYSAYKRLRR
jgi:hypothetical protein